MTLAYHLSTVLSVGLFLFYGFACLFFDGMVDEFARYGLSRYRRLTGSLEILGALGLIAGYVLPGMTLVASGGLAVLMLLGTATRIRVRDGLVQTMPAVVLLLVNAFIFLYAAGVVGPLNSASAGSRLLPFPGTPPVASAPLPVREPALPRVCA
jgi:hypothetical protein